MSQKKTIGIVGARGHTGSELIRLVSAHPGLDLLFVSSRELDGQRVADHNDGWQGALRFENLDADAVAAKGADAVILALPNGKGAPFVAAIDAAKPDTGFRRPLFIKTRFEITEPRSVGFAREINAGMDVHSAVV